VHISGEGVTAEVVRHIRPLRNKERMEIQKAWNEARDRLRKEAKEKKTPMPSRLEQYLLFHKIAKESGITEAQLEAFDRWRKQRSDPKQQLNPQLEEMLIVRMTVAADAAPGLREVRLTTRNGMSNPVRFEVGMLAETSEQTDAEDTTTVTEVGKLPVVLNGQIMPGDVDQFRFAGRKGQKLVAAVAARKLVPYLADAVPGWFQATVALYDEHGREVAFADDYHFNPDPVLTCELPADGAYTLEIRDSIYRGREDFVYRVALGELPHVTAAFPLGGPVGKNTPIRLTGWNLPPQANSVTFDPSRRGLVPLTLPFVLAGGRSIHLDADDLPEQAEPGGDIPDEPAEAMAVKLPLVLNGRIDQPGDCDVLRFRASAGQQVVAEVRARALGSPLDALVRITSADGELLAAGDDCEDIGRGLVTHHADPYLRFTAPADGEYLLHLTDTQNAGGPAWGYRLRLSAPRPGFALRIVPSVVNARPGSTVSAQVHALRRDGFDGPIALSLVDAGEGFVLSGGLIPAGIDEIPVTLSLPRKVGKDPQPRTLRLAGSAEVDGRTVRREARPAENVMQAFIYHHLVTSPAWIWMPAGSGGWVDWRLAEAEMPLELRPGQKTSLRVTGPRRRASEVRLALAQPTEGVNLGRVQVEKDDLIVELRAQPDMAEMPSRGNLIIEAYMERKPRRGGGKARRVPLGPLPAIPYVVAGE
jgi:hypothetical protein